MSIATLFTSSRRAARAGALLAASALIACGDDSGDPVTLTLLTPEDGQVLTLEDDTNPGEPGVQFDVTGQSSGLRAETPVELHLDGEAEGATARVDADGKVTLSDVTLQPGTHTIYIVTSVGSVRSADDHSYTLRALVIEDPEDGDEISEDENAAMDGFQITVSVQGYALESDEDVTLRADGDVVGMAAPDEDGTVTFTNVTLTDGDHTLVARSGNVTSEEVEITIDSEVTPPPPECSDVALVSPTGAAGASVIVLGGSACADGSVTTDLEVEVDQPDGTDVALQLNGAEVGTAEVNSGSATFEDVEISDASGNELTLVIGELECDVDAPDLAIDCDAPNCFLRSPEPIENGGVLYVGLAQQADDGGYDVEVETDDEAEGEQVALVIDGNEGDAITVDAAALDGDIVAVFAGVEVADGAHSITATCRDAVGNVATTPPFEITVDTAACGVDISAPVESSVYLLGNDTNPDTAGVQIGGIATVVGDDCVASRSGLCEPGASPAGDFVAFDGSSPHTSVLTLDSASIGQTYCVEIRDRAGNEARDEVSFMLRQVEPMVLIEAPATGTSFNAAGDATHTGDALPATPLCDAEFIIACEVGTTVELHRNDADGALVASGPCTEDDDAPTGYNGRVELTAEISEALDDESATFVATQTFTGGGATLRGTSVAVTVATDCQPPQVEEGTTPCSLHASDQITVVEAADFVVELTDSSADTMDASLSYWTGADVTDPLGEPTDSEVGVVAGGGGSIAFASIDFGAEGPLVVVATLEDDFGNVAEYECESEIVTELPSITVVTWPEDGAEYGPGDSDCDPDGVGPLEYGIAIEVEIDHADDRTASLTVNGDVVDEDVMIDGTTIALCVAVPDNSENGDEPTTIRLQVDEDVGPGVDFIERAVNVHTILITAPEDEALIASDDDCDDGPAFGALVTVEFDPMHVGEDYTIVADGDETTGTVANTTPVQTCVAITTGGERTITASIDDSAIEHSVTVTVVDDTPEIVSIDAPADGEDFGPGEGCVASTPGSYGVLVEATMDQDENREADILVNGAVIADNVPIATDGTISRCVAVPDNLENGGDPTTIAVSLVSTAGMSTPDTASVEINVDTLEIVDPDGEMLLTEGDDCDTGTPAIDYEVVLAVDTMHLGRPYTITDGTAPETGVIMDDSVTACVELSSGTRTITASIGGTSVTDSIEVDVQLPAPEILAVTAPTEGQSFNPGQESCDTGTTSFGVRVQATVDQDDDRIATITVNGGAPITADISGTGAIDECVAVPDNLVNGGNPSTIVLRLEEEPGDRSDTAMVAVNVDLLDITAPTANTHFGPTDDCDDGAGFGIPVSIAVDPALTGQMYAVDGGFADLTGTVGASPITGCLAVDSTTTAVTASITGSPITETVALTVFTGGPPSMAISFTSACPDTESETYREDPLTLEWDLADFEDYEDQFESLELRCAHTTVASATTPDAWWTAATVITLPPGTDVDSTEVELPFRIGETRYCVLRASNDALEMTPVSAGTDVTCGFRSLVLHTGTNASAILGVYNAPVGDVNDDGIDDMLAGGNGYAMLFLGRDGTAGFTGTPDVTFTGPSAVGFRSAGLGDFNGDGRNDFAITNGSFNTVRGRVFIFFGRPAGSPWPALVDLTSECNADLCIDHNTENARFGGAIGGIGEFGGDGHTSVAITATGFASNLGQLFIIQGDDYEVRACALDNPCRANETCTAGSCALAPAETFWGLSYDASNGEWLNPPPGDPVAATLRGFRLDGVAGTTNGVGRSVAPVGAFDSTAGMDFVMSSIGTTTAPAVQSRLWFVSGRNDTTPGFDVLTNADLGFRPSAGAAPNGLPFETTIPAFGAQIAALGDVFDVPGGTAGALEIGVRFASGTSVYLYSGDTNFNPANRVEIRALPSTDFGIGMSRGYHPSIPSLTNRFDDDTRSDFAIGSSGAVSTAVGSVYMFYGDVIPSRVVSGVLSYTEGSPIQPPATTSVSYRIVEAAGDLNDDGYPDLFVGDYQANMNRGQLHLLY